MIDLTKNKIVFGELPKETQDALKALPRGQVQFFGREGWETLINPAFLCGNTYRQKPSRSFTEAFIDLPSGTVFQVETRRYIKYIDGYMAAVLRQLEAPYAACWYYCGEEELRGADALEGFTPDKLTSDDITIEYMPKTQGGEQ